MLPNELQAAIDRRWESFWPTNNVKPLIIIDLITYLLFVKRIEEQAAAANTTEQSSAPALYTEKQKDLRWSFFKDLDATRMHQVFTKEHGVIAFINQYGKGQHRLSPYMKAPLLVTPTPKLLENAVEIVKLLDAADKDVRVEAYEYLLSKLTTSGPNGELPTPPHIARLMVEMMEPTSEDVICDPSAGNGRFLTACAEYLKEKQSKTITEEGSNQHLSATQLIGIEPDPVMLRIGAMNMLLHGVEEAKLLQVNALSKANTAFTEQATLIFANPPFSAHPGNNELDESLLKNANQSRPGILFLAFILKGLKKGGRAAVILPESVLADSSAAHQQVRQQLIEDHRLEAVISMPPGLFRPYTGVGTAILIFTKTDNGGTDKVWFYDMQTDGFSLDDKRKPLQPSAIYSKMLWPEDYGNIPHLLTQWKAVKDKNASTASPVTTEQAGNTGAPFFVPAEAIRQNDFSFRIDTYQQPVPKQKAKPEEIIVPEKEIIAPKKEVVIPIQKPVTQEKVVLPQPSVQPIPAAPIPAKVKRALSSFQTIVSSKTTSALKTIPAFKMPPWPVLLLFGVLGLGALMYVLIRKDRPSVLSATVANMPRNRVQEQKPAENLSDTTESTAYSTQKNNGVRQEAGDEEANDVLSDVVETDEEKSLVSERTRQKTPSITSNRNTEFGERQPLALGKPDVSAGSVQTRYQVKSKAYFHNEPDESTRRSSFINHWNNSYAALNPLDEKNGFVYVVFTNHQGQTSRGWLRKSDLKAVRTVISDDELK